MRTNGWHRMIFPRVPPSAPDGVSEFRAVESSRGQGPTLVPTKRSYDKLSEDQLADISSPGAAGLSGRGTLVGRLSLRQDGLLIRAILTTEDHKLSFDVDVPPEQVKDLQGYRVAVEGNLDKITDTVGRISRPVRLTWDQVALDPITLQEISQATDVKACGGGSLQGILRVRINGHETDLSLQTQEPGAPEVVFTVRSPNDRQWRHLDGQVVRVFGMIDKFAPQAGKITNADIRPVDPDIEPTADYRVSAPQGPPVDVTDGLLVPLPSTFGAAVGLLLVDGEALKVAMPGADSGDRVRRSGGRFHAVEISSEDVHHPANQLFIRKVFEPLMTTDGTRLTTLLRDDAKGVLFAFDPSRGMVYGLKSYRVDGVLYARPYTMIQVRQVRREPGPFRSLRNLY